MKTTLFVVISMWMSGHGYGQWMPPAALTMGSMNHTHPSPANSFMPEFDSPVEWMSYVESNDSISRIVVRHTAIEGMVWLDSVDYVTPDSIPGDEPTLAVWQDWSIPDRHMLIWRRSVGASNLCYTQQNDGEWSEPQALTQGVEDDHNPFVIPTDSGFAAVWERDGRICYSSFQDTGWTNPVTISAVYDSGNHRPQMKRFDASGSIFVVIWEKEKPGDTSRAVCYAIGGASGWSDVDTLAYSGDNRNPRFIRADFPFMVDLTYNSDYYGSWKTLGASGYVDGDSVEWFEKRDTLDVFGMGGIRGEQLDASFMVFPIITRDVKSRIFPVHVTGTWQAVLQGLDSIGVTDPIAGVTFFGTGINATDRHPAVGNGIYLANGQVRVWSLWESNAGGNWQIYGSWRDFDFLGIEPRRNSVPGSIRRLHNYPNPFNPHTTIAFELMRKEIVSLRVYNVLGETVRDLMAGEFVNPGVHRVTWDGRDNSARRVASGIYFYQVTARSGEVLTGIATLVK